MPTENHRHSICLLNDSFPPVIDGVANAVVNYAENIEAHHGSVLVATPAVPGADDSRFSFPVLRYPSLDIRKQVGYVAGYPFSPEVAHRVKEQGVELLHLHCPALSAVLARQLREAYDLPLVLTYHTKYDIDIKNAVHSRILRSGAIAALLENVNACDEVWTVSRGAGENLRSLGYEGEFLVMENGVDFPRGKVSDKAISAATEGYDLPAGVPVFLFVGRLMWYKGLRIILDALAALREKKLAFRMVFIGDGGDAGEVRAYTQKLGLEDVCLFTGAISERDTLRAWYSRADLFLFPSSFDTNGLVVREAAACDLATVMIAGSCAAEGVTDGRNGFCIEENAAAMEAKLEALYDNPAMAARVGEAAGRELYLSWEEAVARAAARYEVVLENHRSGRYPRRYTINEDFLRAQGELMEALGEIGGFRQELLREVRAEQTEARERLTEIKTELRDYAEKKKAELWKIMDRYM